MQIDLFQILHQHEALPLFICIALGYWLGNLSIGKIKLGAGGGVLLTGIVFGHYGFTTDPMIGTVGFILFIYSVGLQAGPRFFSVFAADGTRYIVLAVFVAALGYGLAKGLANVAGLDDATAAGIMAGALTSTPTLIGAQTAVESGAVVIGDGQTTEALMQSISVGYAITYVFGTIGLMLVVGFMPGWMGIDLPAEATEFARARGYDDAASASTGPQPIVRIYEVGGAVVGRRVDEIQRDLGENEVILRFRRGDDVFMVEPDFVLESGDRFALLAPTDRHRRLREQFKVSKDIIDDELLTSQITVEEIIISRKSAAGKALSQLHINEHFGCFLSSIRRSQIELPLADSTVTQIGDVLTVAGEQSMLDRLADDIGQIERKVQETDLVTFAAGIAVGLFVGLITIKLGGLNVGLGTAGGLLVTGIIVGSLRARNPGFGRVPPAARYVFMEFGLVLFLVGVGLRAGGGIVDALQSAGLPIIVIGAIVTLSPLIIGFLFGRVVLKMNPAVLLGALTGAMTSTPALGVVQDAAKSPVPALGYAGTYAFANILLTMAGAAIMLT